MSGASASAAGTADAASTGAAAEVIRFRDATVVYPGGVRALDGLDLTIPSGQFVVVVGLSGAGKSTLLRAINGFVPLTSGEVEVAGRSLVGLGGRDLRQLRSRVGMIFQDYRLIRRLSVLQNVLMGRLARVPTWRAMTGLWPREDLEVAWEALERVGIAEKAWARASNLSGGQQQRVGIARALAQKPRIILADEPVASLDPVTSHQVMEDLLRINRELGITTLVNLHFLDLAKRYGERIIGLRAGRLVFDGSAREIREDDFREIYGRPPSADDVLEAEVAI